MPFLKTVFHYYVFQLSGLRSGQFIISVYFKKASKLEVFGKSVFCWDCILTSALQRTLFYEFVKYKSWVILSPLECRNLNVASALAGTKCWLPQIGLNRDIKCIICLTIGFLVCFLRLFSVCLLCMYKGSGKFRPWASVSNSMEDFCRIHFVSWKLARYFN